MHREVSIIIPSSKNQIQTLESLKHCPVPYRLIIVRKHGLGFARNWGARQASNKLLIFLDDDVELQPEMWHELLLTNQGEFKMVMVCGSPATRVFVIHTEDFWSINGFDEKLVYGGEDRDFYLRAVKHGLKLKLIQSGLINHISHKPRLCDRKITLLHLLEICKLVARHGNKYIEFKRFLLARALGGSNLPRFVNEVVKFLGLVYYLLSQQISNMK